mmetsp:Transcript_18621/g.52025  ORF Transcript_18621/g.52025 Transcript_18621/m.52025 type:complete len:296 (-) Transcript_18621:356-1243(-)
MADYIDGSDVRLSRTGKAGPGRFGIVRDPRQANVRVSSPLPRGKGLHGRGSRPATTNRYSPDPSLHRWKPIRGIAGQDCRWRIRLLDRILCADQRAPGIRPGILSRHAQVLCQDVQVPGDVPRKGQGGPRGTDRGCLKQTGRSVQETGRNPRFRDWTAQGTRRRPDRSGPTGRLHGPAGIHPQLVPQNHELHIQGRDAAGAVRRRDAPHQRSHHPRSRRVHQGRGGNPEAPGKGAAPETPRGSQREQDARFDDRGVPGPPEAPTPAEPGGPRVACGFGPGFPGGCPCRPRHSTRT